MALPFTASFAGGAGLLVDPPFKWYLQGTGITAPQHQLFRDGSSHAITGQTGMDAVTIDDSNTYGNGQKSQVTIASTLSAADYIYLLLNSTGNFDTGNGYLAWYNGNGTDVQILRRSGVSWNTFASLKAITTGATLVSGDTLLFSHDGAGHLTLSRNGTIISAMSVTDGTPLTAGLAGAGVYADTVSTNALLSAWTADNVSSGFSLTASNGSYAITGEATNNSIKLPAAFGTYAITGEAVTLTQGSAGLSLSAAFGSYGITGESVTLQQLPGGFTLIAQPGAYNIVGASASSDLQMSAAFGSYAIVGENTNGGISLAAAFGSYALTGEAVTFAQGGGGASLTAAFGAYAMTGEAVTFGTGGNTTLAAAFGAYTIAGQTTQDRLTMLPAVGSYGITGESVTFSQGGAALLAATFGAYAFAGESITTGDGGFRVMAVSAGYYANVYRTAGDVFDILSAADFSDSSIDYQPPSSATTGFGWMTKVSNATPLFTWQEANNAAYFPAVDPNRRFVY